MTGKQFYDWQTAGGTNDVMKLVNVLERADIEWCAIGGIAVNHWAQEPMVTQDLDFVVATDNVPEATRVLEEAGFQSEAFTGSINFKGSSRLSLQCSTEALYSDFPKRAVAADVHGILIRVASLEDTLQGKLLAWKDSSRRQSKRMKDLLDITRLVESHPQLWETLPVEAQALIDKPAS